HHRVLHRAGVEDAVKRPGPAGDVDDTGVFGCAQQGQERVHHPYGAEDIDRESLHGCVSGQLLSAQPWCRGAGVVDQDVQVPVFVAYPGGRRLDAAVVSRIDVDEGRAELGRSCGATLAVAGTGQHGMTQTDEPPGRLVAQTLVGPGDQRDGHRASLQQAAMGYRPGCRFLSRGPEGGQADSGCPGAIVFWPVTVTPWVLPVSAGVTAGVRARTS